MKKILFIAVAVLALASCKKAPIADFEIKTNPDLPIPGQRIFINTSSDADSYLWEFGDQLKRSSTKKDTLFIYPTNGVYMIKLTVKKGKKSNYKTKFINVEDY